MVYALPTRNNEDLARLEERSLHTRGALVIYCSIDKTWGKKPESKPVEDWLNKWWHVYIMNMKLVSKNKNEIYILTWKDAHVVNRKKCKYQNNECSMCLFWKIKVIQGLLCVCIRVIVPSKKTIKIYPKCWQKLSAKIGVRFAERKRRSFLFYFIFISVI